MSTLHRCPCRVLTQGRAERPRALICVSTGQVRWGQLAQLYLLDARQYRNAQTCGPAGTVRFKFFNPAQCDQWADPRAACWAQRKER